MKRYGDGLMVETIKDVRSLTRRREGVFYAYKYSEASGRSATQKRRTPKLRHKLGATLEVKNASINQRLDCDAGVNVATKRWIMGPAPIDQRRFYDHTLLDWRGTPRGLLRLWVVRFTRRDLACVPTRGKGKFRLFRCKIVAHVPVKAPKGYVCENALSFGVVK
jgi:hypothetical protein